MKVNHPADFSETAARAIKRPNFKDLLTLTDEQKNVALIQGGSIFHTIFPQVPKSPLALLFGGSQTVAPNIL